MRTSQTLHEDSRRGRLRFLGESSGGVLGRHPVVFLWLHFALQLCAGGFLCLLIVVAEAILCGFWQATIVSVVAAACLDFFYYPPYLTLNITDPQDWVALGAFEMSALVVSRVSSREQRSSQEASLQRMAMEQLYELSRSTLLINLHQAAWATTCAT